MNIAEPTNKWWLHFIDRDSPRAKVNGVEYALTYGDGFVHLPPPNQAYTEPIYVWVAVCDPTYVAPLHVSRACDDYLQLGYEVEAAELAAGWDPNP